jgi:hypothetical protein
MCQLNDIIKIIKKEGIITMQLTTTTIFTALEQKWRFPSKRGPLTIEDLFDLPLTKNNGLNLDNVAIEINKQLQEKQDSTSFVESTVEKTDEITKLDTMLEIVKTIIKQRQEENKTKLQAAEIASKRKQLQDLIDQKQGEALASLSLDELQQKLDELK